MPTINNLPELTTATGEMVFPIVDNTGATTITKKATLATFQEYVIGTAPIGYTGSQGYNGSQGTAGYTGSRGAMFSRTLTTGTTVSLASSATADISVVGFNSYALLNVAVSTGSWVTIYTNTATRTSDAGRSIFLDPTPNSGVVAEIISTGSTSLNFTPAVIGFTNNTPPSADIPLKIYNNTLGTRAITVTLTLIRLEG
jgi:hypothetical protein